MIDRLNELNNIKIYSIHDEEFSEYGRVLEGFDTSEILEQGKKIQMPESGSKYEPATESFEKLAIHKQIENKCFGELPVQTGFCWGYSSMMNAFEWHTSSEINIAITDLVLILAKTWEVRNGKINSDKAKAFYLREGDMVEVFATTMHFCPCQVQESGFKCVVALPKDTNVPLDRESEDKLLFRKNKWIIAHEENKGLIERGVVSGITGENYVIKY